METEAANSPAPTFLTLPREIRDQIYASLLSPDSNRKHLGDGFTKYDYRGSLVVLHLNRQIYYEARDVFRRLNTFIKIETPWAEVHTHVAMAGLVPVLLKGEAAREFTQHQLLVSVRLSEEFLFDLAHVHQFNMRSFVILADDLTKFTDIWAYDALSNNNLNVHLVLTLRLRAPFTTEWEEKIMTKGQQQRLLLPFGDIKGLHDVKYEGDLKPYSSVVSEVTALRAKPVNTAEQCLSEGIRLKDLGNEQLKKGNYQAALDVYSKSWKAVHIVVIGHTRHIHADAYYSRMMGEPFDEQHGQALRLNLRIQLVANTCMAYMKLENWDEVVFWGMRTINMIRASFNQNESEAPPEREAMPGFPGAVPLGKIYYRTAVALRRLNEQDQARSLLKVAAIYLPNDEKVQEELRACALRLG